MTINLHSARINLERKKGARDKLVKQYKEIQNKLEHLIKESEVAEQAHVAIQEVAKLTQKELEYHVSNTVSRGLAAIFDDPYKFCLEFVLRRDKTEADLIWERDGSQYLPNGGGVRDISSFALLIAMRSIQARPGAPFFALDEPFKGLKPSGLQTRAGVMLREISKGLGLQLLIITHDAAIIESADTSYEVTQEKGVSLVNEIRRNNG